jgi:serine protease Do
MNHWTENIRKSLRGRRLIAPAMALALSASVLTYEATKPAFAKSPSVAPTATPLDDNSVGALLSLDHAMETLAARVTPAVVNVAVTSRAKATPTGMEQMPDDMQQFFGPGFGHNTRPEPQIEHGIGSGVLISPDGYIVTNNHVVDGAVEMRVTMSDRRVLSAKLIGVDPLTDLAVIKVNGSNLPNVPWGDSKALHPGQTVLAFGNPFGLRFTVTRGIVSALNRANPDPEDRRKPGEYIQTDAAINQGNSGGALVNAHGELVGINTFLISPSGTFSGMGFAIPSQVVRPTVDTLIRDGKVTHGYMGISITDVSPENAQFFHLPDTDTSGAVVDQVEADSPAAKAGLKVGDVIRAIDGEKVTGAGDLQVEVSQKQPGNTIKLQVLRDGRTVEIPVTVQAMGARNADESTGNAQGKPRWGLGLADLTPDVREQIQAPSDVKGAVIERVQPGSSADDAGLRSGDIIVEVNRHPVQSAADVQQQLGGIPNGKDALVLVWSRGGNTFRVLHSPEGA